MNPKDFRYDGLQYWRDDDSEESEQVVKDYAKCTLPEILEFYNNVATRQDISKDEKELRLKILRLYIAQELYLVDRERLDYFIETAAGEIEQLECDMKELKEQFKKHRHCLNKTYGETPIW